MCGHSVTVTLFAVHSTGVGIASPLVPEIETPVVYNITLDPLEGLYVEKRHCYGMSTEPRAS